MLLNLLCSIVFPLALAGGTPRTITIVRAGELGTAGFRMVSGDKDTAAQLSRLVNGGSVAENKMPQPTFKRFERRIGQLETTAVATPPAHCRDLVSIERAPVGGRKYLCVAQGSDSAAAYSSLAFDLHVQLTEP